MCERCNPLGLEQPATTQVHGTVFVALMLAIVVLAVAGRAVLSGVGPFRGEVRDVVPAAGGLEVTLLVSNDGSKTGATTCQLTRTANRGIGASEVVQTPQVGPGQPVEFTTTTNRFGTAATELSVVCSTP
jgi:hypothetical protein